MHLKRKFLITTILLLSFIIESHIDTDAAVQSEPPVAIIIFIGDGMGEAHRTAARWFSVGQDGSLIMDQLPVYGWTQTASANNPVTDSAAAATAIATGQKTNVGYIGVDPDGAHLMTILEVAQEHGYAVGLVTTVPMAHATPGAFAAHIPDRTQMTEIARQMLEHRPEVLLGGGEDEFLPLSETGCYPEPGERTDGRDLIQDAIDAGYVYTCDAASFSSVNPLTTTHLLGLFADEELIYPSAPSLAELTDKAIAILSQNPKGFFLMVEAGQIDWAAHINEAAEVITHTLGLDSAVGVGTLYAASNPNTTIIVAADHETGGMSVGLTPTGGPGEDGPFSMPNGTPFYINWTTDYHTGVDVPLTAAGPLSDHLSGTQENTDLFEIMRARVGWEIWLPVILHGTTIPTAALP